MKKEIHGETDINKVKEDYGLLWIENEQKQVLLSSLTNALGERDIEIERLKEALEKILSINAAPSRDQLISRLKLVAHAALYPDSVHK